MPKASMSIVLALALSAAGYAVAYADRGILYLDDYTFDRVIDGTKDVLVRFDKEYAWGDTHDTFKVLGKKIGASANDILVASVPISKREYEPEGGHLASRYGANEEAHWPTYLLFKRGVSSKGTPLHYPREGVKDKPDPILQWLADKTGAFFGLKGQVAEFHALAAKVPGASAEERRQLARQAEELLEKGGLSGQDQFCAEFYVKVFNKAAEEADYVAKELTRLRTLHEGPGVSATKRESFQTRINILLSFGGRLGGAKGKKKSEEL